VDTNIVDAGVKNARRAALLLPQDATDDEIDMAFKANGSKPLPSMPTPCTSLWPGPTPKIRT